MDTKQSIIGHVKNCDLSRLWNRRRLKSFRRPLLVLRKRKTISKQNWFKHIIVFLFLLQKCLP